MKTAAFLLLLLYPLSAHGLTPTTVQVPELGGTFEISVLRGTMTPLVFPFPVTKTIGWSTDEYVIKRFESTKSVAPPNIVTIEPSKTATWASLTIYAGTIQVHLLVRAVDDESKATSSVLFVPREAEEQFQARVSKAVTDQLKPLQTAAENKQKDYEALIARNDEAITKRAMQIIANGVRMDALQHRSCGRSIRATKRSRHGVLRLHEIRWIGKHAFIVFSVLNRGARDYPIGAISLRQDGTILPITTSFSSTDKKQHVLVPSAARVGVVGLADAAELLGQQATLHIAGANRTTLEIEVPLVAGHDS
ncbi:MAG: hypothetical protein MJE77_16150 [Proteobacteria bacterium]|nr:hypothetical protein [Pseudomonadota bacterium]